LLAATVAAASAAALSLFASACLTAAASAALRPSHGRLSHKVTVLIQT
jgi:hypothetical protein